MVIGSKVSFKGRLFTYMGESSVMKGMVSLYGRSGSIVVNHSLVRSI